MQGEFTSNHDILKKVGVNILKVRTAKNLTIEELSRKSGMDSGLLSNIELGLVDISFTTLLTLGDALEVSPSRILENVA